MSTDCIPRQSSTNIDKLRGLTDKTDLVKTWDILSGDGRNAISTSDFSIIWNLKLDKTALLRFNIINILNFIRGEEGVGHWILYYQHPDLSYYYDPYGIVPPTSFIQFLGLDAIACNVRQDQKGGDSCGFYCLCEAYNIFNKLKSDSYVIIRKSNGDIVGDVDKKIYDRHVELLPIYYNH